MIRGKVYFLFYLSDTHHTTTEEPRTFFLHPSFPLSVPRPNFFTLPAISCRDFLLYLMCCIPAAWISLLVFLTIQVVNRLSNHLTPFLSPHPHSVPKHLPGHHHPGLMSNMSFHLTCDRCHVLGTMSESFLLKGRSDAEQNTGWSLSPRPPP